MVSICAGRKGTMISHPGPRFSFKFFYFFAIMSLISIVHTELNIQLLSPSLIIRLLIFAYCPIVNRIQSPLNICPIPSSPRHHPLHLFMQSCCTNESISIIDGIVYCVETWTSTMQNPSPAPVHCSCSGQSAVHESTSIASASSSIASIPEIARNRPLRLLI
jgi:hypothetical protein